MALRPEDLEFMRQYASGAPPAELRSRLDSMYGPVTPEMTAAAFAPEPDERTAGNAPSIGYQYDPSQLKPIAAPTVSDTGAAGSKFLRSLGASETVNPLGGVADSRSAIPVVEDPNAPYAPVPKEQMRVGLSAAPEQPSAPMRPYDPVGLALQRETLDARRGSPGQVIPGGEQLESRTILQELPGKMRPETAEELEAANMSRQGMAVAQGESAAEMLKKQARAQGQQAQRARAELADYRRTTAAKQAEYDLRRAELDDMRAQVQREPITFFSGDKTGHAVTKAIGLGILGILGGPRMVMQVIDNSIAQKEKERGQAISLLDDQLDRFKAGIPSPEAQQLYTRSLGLDAAAAEADRMASLAKGEAERQRGFAMAEQLRVEALLNLAQAEKEASRGKVETKIKNVAPKYVGGKRPKTYAEIAKEQGKTVEEVIENEITGERARGGGGPQSDLDLSKTKYERSVSVRLPDGTRASANDPEEATSIRNVFESAKQIDANYDDNIRLVRQHGGSAKWDPKALGRIKANVADTKLALKEAKKLGVMSASDEETIAPLSGADAADWVPGQGFEGAMQRAKELIHAAEQRARERLTKGPWSTEYITTPAGGAGSTFKPET